jgi:cytochrome P450
MSEVAVAVRTLAGCPGPRGLPLLGNLHQLDVTRLSAVLESWADRYGPLYRIRLGGRDALVVADVDAIHTMLRQRPDGYRRLHTIESVLAELGITGAFSAEGEDWRRLRRLAMQSLHAGYLRRYSGTVARVTARLHERWARAAATAADVDVQQDMMRYTVDVIAGLSLGYDLNTLQDDSDPLQARLREFFPMVNRRVNAAFPYWRYVRLPADRRLDRARAEIDTTVRDIIRAARLRRAADDRPPADMLEAMLAPQDGVAAFTDAEIAGTVITMLLAGQETTASTMSWMVHCMIEHPEVQARMREEADRVSGAAGADIDATGKLPYVEAVINETMRLRPIAPVLFLEPNDDTVIADLRVPRGTPVFALSMYHARRDSHFAHGGSFDPDRWLRDGAVPRSRGHDTWAFLPFGAGPRYCPGRNLAMLEATMVAAMLVRNFEITRPPPAPAIGARFAFTYQPVGLTARITARPATDRRQ